MFMIGISHDPGVAVVTGAASGLGKALTALLTDTGWRVAGIDRAPCPDLEHSAVVDVTDADAVADAVAGFARSLGELSALAVCAGVFENSLVPAHALPLDLWTRTLAVNAGGAFHAARAVLPHLMDRGGGSIVFTGSVAAQHPQPGGSVYSASKAAVAALSRVIALEYADHGIRSNAVLPGYMRTAMTEQVLARDALREQIERHIPMRRVAAPGEVAATIAYLLSPASGYVTGQEFVVDGGSTLTAFVDPDDVPRMWRRLGRSAP